MPSEDSGFFEPKVPCHIVYVNLKAKWLEKQFCDKYGPHLASSP